MGSLKSLVNLKVKPNLVNLVLCNGLEWRSSSADSLLPRRPTCALFLKITEPNPRRRPSAPMRGKLLPRREQPRKRKQVLALCLTLPLTSREIFVRVTGTSFYKLKLCAVIMWVIIVCVGGDLQKFQGSGQSRLQEESSPLKSRRPGALRCLAVQPWSNSSRSRRPPQAGFSIGSSNLP